MPRATKSKDKGSVDIAQVERLAALSRLSVEPKEAERLRIELSSILDYFAALDKVDVSKAELTVAGRKGGELRRDVVAPSTPEALLAGVPQKKGRFVRAPRVF